MKLLHNTEPPTCHLCVPCCAFPQLSFLLPSPFAALRLLAARYCGYEVTTEGDSFTVAFHDAFDAVCWALAMQQAMMEAGGYSCRAGSTCHDVLGHMCASWRISDALMALLVVLVQSCMRRFWSPKGTHER